MEKKLQQRMCVVCRQMYDKSKLFRIVLSHDGEAQLDLSGKASGRGAYICSNPDCLKNMTKKKALSRAFRREIPLCQYDAITEKLNATTSGQN